MKRRFVFPKRGVVKELDEIQISLKGDKSVEFSSDIMTHMLLVLFIQLENRRYLASYSFSAKTFKWKIILS